jgi:chloride channel protein, CIC family
VLFVVEAVIGSWTSTVQIGSIVLGSVTSVMVIRYFLGPQLFHLPAINLGTPRELLGFIVIGVTATVVGLLLDRFIRALRARTVALPAWTYCFQVATAGVAVGAVAYLGFPQVMGPGYNIIGQYGQFGWKLLLGLAILKLVLVALSFATRTPGGIIAPTLFIGAMLGSAVGGLEHFVIKNTTVSTSAYVLVGMAALFAVVLRAPLASVLLVAELSGSYSAMFPAILAVGTSWLLARALQRHSLFDLLMYEDGIRLPLVEEQKSEAVLKVHDAMQMSDFPVVDSYLTVRQAWREVVDRPGDLIFVRNVDAGWTAIHRSLLDRLEATSDPQQRLDDVIDGSPMPELYPDLPLDMTLRHLHRWAVLPVVSRANIRALQGVVTMETVMARYQSFEAPTRASRNASQCA